MGKRPALVTPSCVLSVTDKGYLLCLRECPRRSPLNSLNLFKAPAGLVVCDFLFCQTKNCHRVISPVAEVVRGVTCSLNRNRKSGGSSSDSSSSATPMCRQRPGRSVRNQTLRIKNHFTTGALVAAMVTHCLIYRMRWRIRRRHDPPNLCSPGARVRSAPPPLPRLRP